MHSISIRLLRLLSLILAMLPCCLWAQTISCGGDTPFRVLHFTKTNGFDHNTRVQSAQLFRDLGELDNFTVTDTDDASVFDHPDTLQQFALIIFSNTSGNGLLNSQQQQNVENYINAGGNFMGIHAATDTYRDQSWPFYNSLVGGIVQANPNHTRNNFPGTMDVVTDHPSTINLPNPWQKNEEYYYWERNGGQLDSNITTTLRVRSTGEESYDAARPITWYQEFAQGARSYYTALGHARSNYTDPQNDFRQLLRDALCWCVERQVTKLRPDKPAPEAASIVQNPVSRQLQLNISDTRIDRAILYTASGVPVRSFRVAQGLNNLGVADLLPGMYFLHFPQQAMAPLKVIFR